MKMEKRIQFIVVLSVLLLASCSSSISSDAQKIADLQCKVIELQQKMMSGEISDQQDVQEYMTQATALLQEMNAKYVSIEDKQKFQEELSKAKANCN